jgi:GntR family transcriptional repressor for pyruvate dehydrogenase complex
METSLAALVVQNASDSDVAALRSIVESMATAQADDAPTEERIELDLAFHRRFAAASRNPLMEKIYRFVLDFLEPSIRETYGSDKAGRPVEVHTGIVAALARRDAAGLREAVEASIDVWNRLST